MSRRRRLLCSLPLVALALVLIGRTRLANAAPVQPGASAVLIDSNDVAHPTTAQLASDDAKHDQPWTILWDDLGMKDSDAPVISGGGPIDLHPAPLPAQAPPIIAAPLPPAIVSGIIGLVGVYVYKRRNRFANR